MLSKSFPRSPWFFLQIVTIMGTTSNLSFNPKEASNYPKGFMTDPSNCRSCKLLFRKVGFLEIYCYKRYLTDGLHLYIKIEVVDFNLYCNVCFHLFNFFYLLVFVFYRKDFHIGFVFFNAFNVFLFEFACCLKMVLFKQFVQVFPNAGHFPFFLFHVHVHNSNIFLPF